MLEYIVYRCNTYTLDDNDPSFPILPFSLFLQLIKEKKKKELITKTE